MQSMFSIKTTNNFRLMTMYQSPVYQNTPCVISFTQPSIPLICPNSVINSHFIPYINETTKIQSSTISKNVIIPTLQTKKLIMNSNARSKHSNAQKKCNDNGSSKDGKNFRKKFTPEEDEKLKEIVERTGSKKWSIIAREMNGRTARQCRDRYQNYLIPGFFNGQWSPQEDKLLYQKFIEMGSQWSKMTHFFTNRSANALKNRWNYYVSKHLNEHICQTSQTEVDQNEDSNLEYKENDENYDECQTENIDQLENNDFIYENFLNFATPLDLMDLESIQESDEIINGSKIEDSIYPKQINP